MVDIHQRQTVADNDNYARCKAERKAFCCFARSEICSAYERLMQKGLLFGGKMNASVIDVTAAEKLLADE